MKEEGAWIYQGTAPQYLDDVWIFSGRKPRLEFVYGNDSYGVKFEVTGPRIMTVAANSEAGLAAGERIRSDDESFL